MIKCHAREFSPAQATSFLHELNPNLDNGNEFIFPTKNPEREERERNLTRVFVRENI